MASMPDFLNSPLDCSRFVNLSPIAVGTYGQVFVANDELQGGKEVVIKKIAKSGDNRRIQNEIGTFERMPPMKRGIVRFHGFFESVNHFYLVFDRIKGGDLYNLMESNGFVPLAEGSIRKIMKSVTNSLAHCHAHGIAHRDIKMENIILDHKTGVPVIIDFGLCSFFENFNGKETASSDFCGSLEYVPPEIIAQIPFAASKADSWALGVTLFALVFGQFPFSIVEQLEEGSQNPFGIFGGNPSVPLPTDESCGFKVSEGLRHLLSGLLKYDPMERISVTEASKHPWLSKLSKVENPRELNNSMDFSVSSPQMMRSSMLVEV